MKCQWLETHVMWHKWSHCLFDLVTCSTKFDTPHISRFMGPTWGPRGDDRTQVGPMLAPWTLLSGIFSCFIFFRFQSNSLGRAFMIFWFIWKDPTIISFLSSGERDASFTCVKVISSLQIATSIEFRSSLHSQSLTCGQFINNEIPFVNVKLLSKQQHAYTLLELSQHGCIPWLGTGSATNHFLN